MIHYRDMTFCTDTRCTCERRLTPEIEKDAADFGLPVAVTSECICAGFEKFRGWEDDVLTPVTTN